MLWRLLAICCDIATCSSALCIVHAAKNERQLLRIMLPIVAEIINCHVGYFLSNCRDNDPMASIHTPVSTAGPEFAANKRAAGSGPPMVRPRLVGLLTQRLGRLNTPSRKTDHGKAQQRPETRWSMPSAEGGRG